MNEKWNEDLVSVIMPVYKTDKDMLHKAIRSILDQDYKNMELIIVEDPSSLISGSVIQRFKDPRVIYLLNRTRTSFAQQLNIGMDMSKGEYIARMDADDISEPCRLSHQYRFMVNHPEFSVVGTNLKIILESEKVVGFRFYPETFEKITHKMRLANAIAHPSVMFKKKDVVDLGGFRSEYGVVADYDLWCRMFLAGKKFYNIQQPLLRYRVHSRASKMTSLKETLQITLKIKRLYFKGKKNLWGPREAFRYKMEQLLMLLPSQLIIRMFLASTVRRLKTR